MIIIDSSKHVYVHEHSDYNHQYFRNVKTNEILLEKVGYAAGYNLYYNIVTNPTYSIEDSKNVNIDNFANCHG